MRRHESFLKKCWGDIKCEITRFVLFYQKKRKNWVRLCAAI